MMKDHEKEPFWWDEAGFETNYVANLIELRVQRGMSQSELAKRASEAGLQFHQPTVQRIEVGERPIKLTEAIELARILGSTLSAMMLSPTGSGVRRSITDITHKATEFPIMLGQLRSKEREIRESATELADLLNQLEDATPVDGDSELRSAAHVYLQMAGRLGNIYQAAITDFTEALAEHDTSSPSRQSPA
ncbi:helix-turn-helix transcriptional regulator [Paenarthrobacter ureafaciens]|uniref:helix-turn-helix domain-containing protein n=1 Tax=Paenarthrobacter ureafaciens TaxID=37931 RepID=UPI00084E78CD|nr:helix-turn-helix transcriptional regulator [Paenarthrobacter ureafaciens]OEH58385.1 hypothetical protein A5N17_01795 [Arthrobacter sp. D2]OEH62025.1 hypothetical protein A5N13_15170 [Arthrobacter sp. D4]QMU82110.1 helix-turn-helix transcriptional regulator [Paenarthrobacter ureafaciens]